MPLGQGGTSRFTEVSHHLNVCWRPSTFLSVSVPEFCTQYFRQFFANECQILRYDDQGQDL